MCCVVVWCGVEFRLLCVIAVWCGVAVCGLGLGAFLV